VSFEEYASARLPVLIGTARALCADMGLAEDLVQDVLVKLCSRWDLISGLDAPDAYVSRMLINEFVSWRRKWARFVPFSDIRATGRELAQPDHASTFAQRDELLSQVRTLPPRQRAVIALRYFADLDDTQIASALGCTASTVRVHAARALRSLGVAQRSTVPIEERPTP
jgi:RNA polymerase sigma-70 factor (sigma-E family)